MSIATPVPFMDDSFSLLKESNVLGALCELHGVWFPQRDGIHRAGRLGAAQFAFVATLQPIAASCVVTASSTAPQKLVQYGSIMSHHLIPSG